MTNEFIIGLGGQGGRSIQEFRRTVELRRKDYYSICKDGARFEYLYIDSNTDITGNNQWSVFGKSIALEANQMIQLRPEGALPNMAEIVEYPNIKPWIGDLVESFRQRANVDDGAEVKTLQTMRGAGQLRRFGRALFAIHAQKIRSVLKEKIDRLKTNRVPKINFHIFCTLGGGTGSGSLVDMITLIQTIVNEDKTTDAKIFVYAYVGGPKADPANTGSFYENQYCSLRDLNALAVGDYQPFVTGKPVQDARDCKFDSPLAINRIYLSSDSSPGNPELDSQIVSMAASCFDSIIYSYKFKSAACLRAISDEDLVDVTPGETNSSGKIVRSYRFAVMGSRRWRVPTEQIRQLLTTDTEERVWDALLKGSSLPDGIEREIKAPEGFVFNFTHSSVNAVYQQIEDELLAPVIAACNNAKTQKRREASVLSEITAAAESAKSRVAALRGDQQKKLLLVPEYKKTVAKLEAELQRCLDKATTWGNKTEVWGIEDVLKFLADYKSEVANWAQQFVPGATKEDVDKTSGDIEELMTKREAEWRKLGPLSISCTKLADKMLDAHSQDACNLVKTTILPYKHAIVKELAEKVTVMVRELEASVESHKDRIESFKADTGQLIITLLNELQTHAENDAPKLKDVYEYDAHNLRKIREAMTAQVDLFESEMYRFSEELRKAVGGERSLITCNSESLDKFVREIRVNHLNGVMERVHNAAKEAEALVSVLVGDIVERLAQIGGLIEDNWNHRLGKKVSDFMANIGISAEIQGNDGLMYPQQSPAAAIVIGLPAGTKNPGLVAWLRNKIEVSKPTKFNILGGRIDFYEHETPEEIRVLYIPYWFPCRFARVMEFVEGKYRDTLEKNDLATLYFSNYDDSGIDTDPTFRRPALTKSGEVDTENVEKTEFATKLYITYKGKERPVCRKSDRGIEFVTEVDELEGVKYDNPYAEVQMKHPVSSYKTALTKAIRMAVSPAPEGAEYASMTKEEKRKIFEEYRAKAEKLEDTSPGSHACAEAAEIRGWVRQWLGL